MASPVAAVSCCRGGLQGITAQLCLRPSPNLLPHPCSYKRGEIHTVFPPFYNFRMRQNLWPNALAKLCGAALGLVRRAGCPHPAKPDCRDCRACRQRILPPFPAVGAACMAARTAPPEWWAFGHRDPVMAAWGHAALRRSAGARRESRACSGGHIGRPYGVLSTWSVGRGAHTPPNRVAGTAGLAVNASCRHFPP